MLRNLGRIGQSRVTWATFGFLLLIQAVVSLDGWSPFDAAPWEFWGLSRNGIKQGFVWQIVSYGLIHGSWLHFSVNGLGLLVLGSRIEHIAGCKVVLVTIAIGIVAGAAAHLLFGSGILVGFSAGVFALWMLLVSLSPQSRLFPVVFCPSLWLGWGVLGLSLIFAISDPRSGFPWPEALRISSTGGFWSPLYDIGHACHFGGGLAGWVVSLWLLRTRISMETLKRQRARRESRQMT